MINYVSLHKDVETTEVRLIYSREEVRRAAEMVEQMVADISGDEVTVDGNVWEQIFTKAFLDKASFFDDAILETTYTATMVIFYFDYLGYPREEVIEYAEEMESMIIDMIEDPQEMRWFLEDNVEEIDWR